VDEPAAVDGVGSAGVVGSPVLDLAVTRGGENSAGRESQAEE
jgi:hypothetical protein